MVRFMKSKRRRELTKEKTGVIMFCKVNTAAVVKLKAWLGTYMRSGKIACASQLLI